MCEAHAFILKDGKEEKVLESVDVIEFEGDEVKLENIFGEQVVLNGVRFKYYSNKDQKIVFEQIVE